jgi:c-di-GMP-binding flagellar brake protein YcgR
LHLQSRPSTSARFKVERRRHRRVLYSAPIRLHCLTPGGVRTSRGISLDISEGGIGALVQNDLMVGGVVEVDLQLPRCSLCAVAIVRHASSVRSGLEFLGLTPEERSQIVAVMGIG